MKKLSEIKDFLQSQQAYLREYYDISSIGIFGSYRHQTQTENSDLDILVEFSKTPGLLKFTNLENYLTDNLGIKVDLVHKKGLKPSLGQRILQEVVYL